MKVLRIGIACCLLLPTIAFAQRDSLVYGKPFVGDKTDPQVVKALREVSPVRIRKTIESLIAFNNRSTISSVTKDLPPNTGIIAASEWIEAQFHAISEGCDHCLEVKVDDFIEPAGKGRAARIVEPTRLRNVYAILKGTDPTAAKRMYLVTGHYDTRVGDVMDTHSPAPGANDDTSGTAVSLESARVLSKYKFPATLVFVTVAGEEQGLNGSKHLAELAKKEGWQLEGVLNNDIVGGDTTPGETLQNKSLVRVFSQGINPKDPADIIARDLSIGLDNDSGSRELARYVLETDRSYFPHTSTAFTAVMELRLDRFLRGGDHSSFSALDFPAVRFTEWRENYAHQHQKVRVEDGKEYGDLLKFDDFSYIANVARLNMATLASLASSPGMPQDVKVLTTNLDNNTLLKWSAPASTSATPVYRVLWRDTTANDWQRYTTTEKTEINVPVSKDNVFFGVEACDAAGHCSQAVPPLPERRQP
ncbi:Peptidase family M28 [Bryocella elongata]|uniref:Peptidase family M28 n=1 Tax=Bryocella elongata TaxID=863522 RepID=A0A1H5UHE0_9BACT|nr:M28 family metallopeptidase [Bryocella elongata]SEF74429.1 Peptidase family M28 [Bryocella elongata]